MPFNPYQAVLESRRTNYNNRLVIEMKRVCVGERVLYQPAAPDAGARILEHYEKKHGEWRDILLLFPQNSLDGTEREKIRAGILFDMGALEGGGMSRTKEWEGIEILYKLLEEPSELDGMMGVSMVECGSFVDVSKLDPETTAITSNMIPTYASKYLIAEPSPEEVG